MMGYFLLHEIAPGPPSWFAVIVLLGVPGLIALAATPVVWFFKSPEGRARMQLPPMMRIVGGAFIAAGLMVLVTPDNLGPGFGTIFWIAYWIILTGAGVTCWYIGKPFRRSAP